MMPGHNFLKQRYEHLLSRARMLESEVQELKNELAKCRMQQVKLEDRLVLVALKLFDLLQEIEREVKE